MNRTATIVLALVASLAVASLGGCDFGDLIRVKTPRNIQATETLPPTLTLNEAREEYENWVNATRNDSMRWRTSIERGDEISDLFAQIVLQGLNDVGPELAGVPVLGPALPLLTGIAGAFFVRRPGDKKAKDADTEKDAAWDEAFAAGKAAALEAFREARS